MTARESVLNDLPAKKTGCPGDSNMHRFSNSAATGAIRQVGSGNADLLEHARPRIGDVAGRITHWTLIRERSVEPVERETVSGAIGGARINFFVSSDD